MLPRRVVAVLFTTLFVALALSPLTGASTEATPNGDVAVNGAFTDTRPLGHPLKFYCDANNPTPAAGPGGECAHRNAFVAFDWTTPVESLSQVTLVEGGVRLDGNVFVQQHFNGSEAPDRIMRLFHVEVTGRSLAAGSGGLRVEVRADTNGDGSVESYLRTITLGTTTSTIDVTQAELGLPAAETKLRSIRLWANAGTDLLLSRVSVYATNGVEGRNIHLKPAGDDAVSSRDGVMLLNPGADGQYSFLLGMAADNGDFLPTLDAWLCVYSAEQAFEDRGFPSNVPTMCGDAFVKPTTPGVTKTRVGDAFRVDVPARLLQPSATSVPAVAVYGIVKVDSSYDLETPGVNPEFKSGYLTLARMAADEAGFGVSQEDPIPTPVLIDSDADGTPDYVETDDLDGYSVIITPRLATVTPALAVVTTDTEGDYHFDLQVYAYDGATGAPIALDPARGIAFALFDATSVVNGGSFTAAPLWLSGASDVSVVDATTFRVSVPGGAVPANVPLGAWAFYDVDGHHTRTTAFAPAFGPSDTAFDFYSALRTAARESRVADGMRNAGTPILLDAASLTRDATLVIRVDPDADSLTPLDGTLVLGDGGDGTVSFEYAMVIPEGRTVTPLESHGLAIYDAGGAASDDLQPGSRLLEHAEYVAVGTPTADGWFRVDVPLSAFSEAKGPVGAWAYTDARNSAGFLLSRSGWYNVLKPAAASVSTSAAERALYEPTPIVILDEELGIPRTLASALAGAGTDLLSATNPLVNPGFEADLVVEGHNDRPDNTGGTMTAPPWFLRLDDRGTGQPTNPRSTHEVLAGRGKLGDHVLKVSYHAADAGKGLMLGQLLGAEQGGDALVWRGASGVSFDVYPLGTSSVPVTGVIRYLAADGSIGMASAPGTIPSVVSAWRRVSMALDVPDDARLLGFYLVIDGPHSASFYLDSFALAGARTAMGDARTDVTDGFAVVIQPTALAGPVQDVLRGADGDYYAYTVTVMDYTQGPATTLDVAGLPRTFALRTLDLQRDGGITLPLRGRTDAFAAFVPVDDVPGPMAVPWAFVDAGDPYATLNAQIQNHPASGHYNPLKNSIAGTPFADQLDYAATPVTFGSRVALTQSAAQTIRLTPVSGGYGVIVSADTPYVESTLVRVTSPTTSPAEYPVTLASAGGDMVPGLVLTTSDLQSVTLTSLGTRFTRGATLVAGSPIASFEVCRPGQGATCLDTGILTGEALAFHSTSLSPTGESLTHVWTFGDGRVSTESDFDTTHTYARPGVKLVNLTVQTPTGKQSSVERALTVNNRAPTIAGIDVTPATVFTDSTVRVRARASDPDGGTLTYAWTVDGVAVPNGGSSSLLLTASVLENATGVPVLEKRAYAIGVSVSDGQGAIVGGSAGFTVQDRPSSISVPALSVVEAPASAYALPGETVLARTTFTDADDVPSGVDLEVSGPGIPTVTVVALTLDAGSWVGTFSPGEVGTFTARTLAYRGAEVLATSGDATIEVQADAAPVVTIAGPAGVDVGSSASYTVSAVDPDGRAIAALSLAGAGVGPCSGCDGSGPGEATATFAQVGVTTLTATAAGASGPVGFATFDVAVDDAIRIEMDFLRKAENATEGHLVRIQVTRWDGAPIHLARVDVRDFYATIPMAVETQTVFTEPDGSVVVRLRPEGLLVGLPLDRHVVATATAGSAPGAPVQDEESATAELHFRNEAGPLGGLLLP